MPRNFDAVNARIAMYIWQAEDNANSLYKATREGSFVDSFGLTNGIPEGVAVDGDGCIWNADGSNDPAYAFRHTKTGSVNACLYPTRHDSDELEDMAVDGDGCIWVAELSGATIYKLRYDGYILDSFASPSDTPTVLGIDDAGCVWSNEFHTDSLYKMTNTGSVITSIGEPAQNPQGMGFDYEGCMWVGDGSDNQIVKADKNGSIVASFSGAASGTSGADPTVREPRAGGTGEEPGMNIWNVDNAADSVYLMYHLDGAVHDSYYATSIAPRGLGTTGSEFGYVLQADGNADSVYKLKPDNYGFFGYSGKIPAPGVDTPYGLDADPAGSLWSTDYQSNDSIYKLNKYGSIIANDTHSWAGGAPRGLGVDANYSLWVANDNGAGYVGSIYKVEGETGSLISSFASPSDEPEGVAVDVNGCIWHADAAGAGAGTVYKFDQTGSVLDSFASPSGDPRGVATNRPAADAPSMYNFGQRLWVSDDPANNVYELRPPEGTALTSFSPPETGPQGPAVDGDGSVWLADDGGTVHKLDDTGSQIGYFAFPGSTPQGLDIDTIGSLWIADSGYDSLYEVTDQGSAISCFGNPGPVGQGVGFDSNGNIWHTDTNTACLYKMNQSGSVISSFTTPSSGPEDVAVDEEDCIWLAERDANTVYKLDNTGSAVDSFAFSTPYGVGVSMTAYGSPTTGDPPSESLYFWNHSVDAGSVYKMAPDGAWTAVGSIAPPGNRADGIGIDADDCMWHSDIVAGSVYKTDPSTGTAVDSFNSPSSNPRGNAFGTSGCIWHADDDAGSIYRLDTTFSVVSKFAAPSDLPQGVGLDSNESIWVADNRTDKIYRVDKIGAVEFSFAVNTFSPRGLTIDHQECIWLSESGNDSIYKYDTSGNLQTSYAAQSTTPLGIGATRTQFH